MLARSALARTVARTSGARRSMSDAPKMHKFKNCGEQLKETRPHSGHAHVRNSFCSLGYFRIAREFSYSKK